jgi:predicted nucleic acid-binding protein
MLPAFFREEILVDGQSFDLSHKAKPIMFAIRLRTVKAFAPVTLAQEFVKVASDRVLDRTAFQKIDPEIVRNQIWDFFDLKIVAVPIHEILERALGLVFSDHISANDSWYVACALHTGGELWLSHDHRDGLADKAEKAGATVKLLTRDRFS